MQFLHHKYKRNGLVFLNLLKQSGELALSVQAINPFISQDPLPNNLLPLSLAIKGFEDPILWLRLELHQCVQIKLFHLHLIFPSHLLLRISLLLTFLSSKVLKDSAPNSTQLFFTVLY